MMCKYIMVPRNSLGIIYAHHHSHYLSYVAVTTTLAISRIEAGIKNGARASNLGFQMEA